MIVSIEKKDRRKAILKSVLKLVNRSGFYHLNMKDIAAEAEVAAGTIYIYFKGKEELINALYSMIVSEFNQTVIACLDEEKDMQTNFVLMAEAALTFHLENPDNFSFMEQYTYAPFLFKEIQDQNFILLRPLYKMFEQGKKENIIKKIDNEILLSIIHGSLNTIFKLHLAKKIDLRIKDKKKLFYDTVWDAIALPKIK